MIGLEYISEEKAIAFINKLNIRWRFSTLWLDKLDCTINLVYGVGGLRFKCFAQVNLNLRYWESSKRSMNIWVWSLWERSGLDSKCNYKINTYYVVSVTSFTRESSHTPLFVHLFINQLMQSYSCSRNTYCIPINRSVSSTVMPLASKEKSV